MFKLVWFYHIYSGTIDHLALHAIVFTAIKITIHQINLYKLYSLKFTKQTLHCAIIPQFSHEKKVYK